MDDTLSLPAGAFARIDEEADELFYAPPRLVHHIDDQRIHRAGLQPRAFRSEAIAADLIQKRFRHLAAGAVMHADEQDVLLCHIASGRERTCERRSWARNNFAESPPAFFRSRAKTL